MNNEFSHTFYDKEDKRVVTTYAYFGDYGKAMLSFSGDKAKGLANCFENKVIADGYDGFWSEWFPTSVSIRLRDEIWNERDKKWYDFKEVFNVYIVKACEELELTMK